MMGKNLTPQSQRTMSSRKLKVADFPDVRFTQTKYGLARYLPLDFPCWVKERVSHCL
jgi:hypothetical protein